MASGLTLAGGAVVAAAEGRFPPSGPVLAATKPTGARAWRSNAAIASARSWSSSSSLVIASPSWARCCWLRAIAWDAMKLTSVL